jgi:3-oxoacyl-[acyl-carrier protein] reductase
MNLENRTAFVTGGSGGLGSAVARALAEHGANVAVGFHSNRDAAIETCATVVAKGRKSAAIELDQSNPQSIEFSVEETVRELGGLDILVNNAAWSVAIPFNELDALTAEVWDRLLTTNLRGPYLLSRTAAPYLRNKGAGRIVNISAFIGLAPMGSSIAHAVSKAGLIHLTRCLAVALAPSVTVNCVAPGIMEGTGMSDRLPRDSIEAMRERAVLKRTTKIEDVAEQVVHFCTADSVTGQTLVVDAGIYFH